MRAVATGVLNMGLRGLTLVSKFLLLLGLARYLAPEELGVYGVFVGTVGIAVYVLGFDIYVYNTREILAQEERHRPAIIRDQAIFHLLAYAVTLPLLLGVFVGGFLAWRYAALFYIVLIFEHLSQEAYRLLLVLSRPIAANMLLFVRAGAWVLPVLLAVFWASDLRRIEVVLAAWAVGAAASVGLATVLLSRLEWRTVRETPIAWHAMQRAALGSVPFFAGTLALRGVEYADRFFLQRFAGDALVGVYTFFFSIANVVQAMVLTGVIQLLYPRVVEAYQSKRVHEYRALLRQMGVGSITVALAGAAIAALAIGPILALVRNPLYGDYRSVLWILLGSVLVSILAWVPHYALYVRRRDRSLLAANAVGLVISLLANAILVPRLGVHGAALASVLANLGIALTTVVALTALRKREYVAA